jgi:hypothetical protein
MLITIGLSSYYDWEPTDEAPTQADIMALKAKPGSNGKWLKKAVKSASTHTTINLPEAEIQNCMAHFERIGLPRTRERTVAFYIEEKTMPHHAHPDHWESIEVHDEPEVEAFLKNYFGLTDEVPETTPADVPTPDAQ